MRFSTVPVTALLAFTAASTAQAGPVSRPPTSQQPSSRDFVGFDQSSRVVTDSITRRDIDPPSRIVFSRSADNDDATVSLAVEPFSPPASLLQKLKRFIIGQDDREEVEDTGFPTHSVGRITWSNGVMCSGALVGPRHVLTAKHCIVTDGSTGTFSPGYDEGERFGSARIVSYATADDQEPGSPCETKFDWAAMVLDADLGNQLGWFGVKLPDSTMLDQPLFTHLGYPGDLDGGSTPQLIDQVSVLSSPTFACDSNGPIYADADTAGGQSGGPLWEDGADGNKWIWGTLSIGVSISTGEGYAGFASGLEMIDTINKLRSDFP